MLNPLHLDALSAVIRTGSFEAAALALAITPSAVSHRIRALEEQVGAVLIVREQPARATVAGARLVRHAEDMERLARDALADVGLAAGGRTRLRIALNADSLATWVLPALVAAGDVLFDVVIEDQDHSADLLRRGEVAAAVTTETAPVQGCDSVALGALRYVATCTPAFRARWFAAGVTAEALDAAPVLVFDRKDTLQHRWAEAVTGRRLALTPHRLPSTTAFVEAARLGLGWSLNPAPLVERALAEGALVPLVDGVTLDTPLVWQASRIGRTTLAPLTAAVRRAARRALVPAPPAAAPRPKAAP